MRPQRFGGQWTGAKLDALREYLVSYTQALKNKPFKLIYIDAFAGSGTYMPTRAYAGSGKQRGSAHIALEVNGFAEYVFIERDPQHCRQLEHLVAQYPHRRTHVHQGDANAHIEELCKGSWHGRRAALFLDPYGLQVSWSTLETIAQTGAIDMWYLFPLNGITRQLARSAGNVDSSKAAALDRTLGTTEWRDALYSQPPIGDLFNSAQHDERHADSTAIADFVTDRLRSVFPRVTDPVILRLSRNGRPDSGAPYYALYFMVSSKVPQAQAVAMRMAEGVLTKLRREGSIV